MPSRRDLLRGALLCAGALPLAACGSTPQPPAGAPRYRISLAQWSLHRALQGGRLDNLDFPRVAREDYGIAGVEYVNSFFRDRAEDLTYLGELRTRAEGSGVRSLLIMVDGEGALGAQDDAERAAAIANHHRWIRASAFLGGHSIRVNAAGKGDRDEHSRRAADSLHQLCVTGEEYGISVIVENHGGPSSDGAWLAETIRRADHPGCGTLPDFGNFGLEDGTQYDRYRGVAELMPYAKAVSAKSHDFDAAGNEVHTDYRRMLDLVVASGYDGWIGVEYEGKSLSEPDGIRATKALLEREFARIEGA
ncbi:sugar phosphate isomerase/epimerase family protein [Engelhardtia mirabilis]|uniref:Xylose isomerase-like TIM barrel n=1 Tax=Engelhardtia mirabilis TaxID=2528011 RepID=A0A518BEZ5_9BACT|nr:Xylose isomerase-like TIM barrel [Planctomycetes bacterium Pla133]QDU99879.1 Xylose isomerase-like TIM barrel [Planctomycetes bacterium Pla86]